MDSKDPDYYLRIAERVTDRELAKCYRDKAAEVSKAAAWPAIERATQEYLAKLRQLGVKLPKRVRVEVAVKAD